MQKQRLFVYGSLRSGFRNPAYQYLTQFFHLLGEAVVKGRFYDKGNTPVAVPTNDDAFITGELYEMNDDAEVNWAFEQLDDYEGLNVVPGETALYKREMTTAYMEGNPYPAWIYWYNRDISTFKEITPGDVLKYLQQINKPG